MSPAAAPMAHCHYGCGAPDYPVAFLAVGRARLRGTGNTRPPPLVPHPSAIAWRFWVRETRKKPRCRACRISASPPAPDHCPSTSKSSRPFRRGTFRRSTPRAAVRQVCAQSCRSARRCRSNPCRTFHNRRPKRPSASPNRPSIAAWLCRPGSTALRCRHCRRNGSNRLRHRRPRPAPATQRRSSR